MKEIYPNTWRNKIIGSLDIEIPYNNWSSFLKPLNQAQIGFALDFLRSGKSRFSTFPPTPVEFSGIAKQYTVPQKIFVAGVTLTTNDKPPGWLKQQLDDSKAMLKSIEREFLDQGIKPDWKTLKREMEKRFSVS